MTLTLHVDFPMDQLQINIPSMPASDKCSTCTVRHRAVCGALLEEELYYLNKAAHHKSISAGQTIMSDEEPAEFVGIITSGVIKLTKTLTDGRQQIVGLQFASDFLGRTYHTHNNFCAEAATDVEMCSFLDAILKNC